MRLTEIFKCLIFALLEKHKATYYKILKSRQFKFVLDWIVRRTPKLSRFNLGTRVCWILHGYTDFPKCKTDGKYISIWLHKNIPATHEYPHYCCEHAHCNADSVQKIKETLKAKPRSHWKRSTEKRKATCRKKYGYESISQLPDIQDKITATILKHFGVKRYSQLGIWKEKTIKSNIQRYGEKWYSQTKQFHRERIKTIERKYGKGYTNTFEVPECIAKANKKHYKKYRYNGVYFDSMPEIAFFIWLVDHHVEFEFHPKIYFPYKLPDGRTRKYRPDFFLKSSGKFIEIKGEQFFDKAGNFVDPYNKAHPEIAQAKFACMMKNKVIVYRQKQYCKYMTYVRKKYGKDYLRSLKA